jgi:hypothetical protein
MFNIDSMNKKTRDAFLGGEYEQQHIPGYDAV